ncbi:hypothetical protein BKA65DRAFT_576475 [Rhexocercosporidium sp. MPI-PUGE-AT-0058]|nr:hypothetical protein BKA65DRAFT_576475 [Rhexocercosporidium sp. MPI-PUGE-AT-0058]
MSQNNNGITGGLENTTLPVAMTLSAFTAIAWYNVIDLNVVIWITFKRRHGLYFYSLLASSWGIFVFALAFLMKFFQVWKNNYVSCALITIGWYAMVTGQSLVLYSRLHLVVRDKRKVRWVLYMIIIDVFLFHFPTTVMTFGANSPAADIFSYPYSLMEKIQVTAFCIQESIISGLYVYYTRQILKPGESFQKKRTRTVMLHLIYVNILVILMDITLLCTQYANLYEIQITFKGALYSIKLRLEFAILNDLMSIAGPADTSHENPYSLSGRGILPTRGQGNEEARNYSCTASGQHTSPFSGKEDNNCVVMTTEVFVKNEERGGIGSESEDTISRAKAAGSRTHPGANGRGGQHKAHSPNSSEVEFAEQGY